MTYYEHTLRSSEVQQFCHSLLRQNLCLDQSSNLSDYLNLVVLAATECKSINLVCKERNNAVSSPTVRNNLHKFLRTRKNAETILNDALGAVVKKKLLKGFLVVAVDVVLLEYYGKDYKLNGQVVGGQRRKGTNYFHGYATAYVNLKGQRYTLAVTKTSKIDSNKDVLKRLFMYVDRLGVRPDVWLFDRGFYSLGILEYLRRRRKPYIMPVLSRGRKPKDPKGPTGTYVFETWKKSGYTSYRIEGRTPKRKTYPIELAVCVTYPEGKGKSKTSDVDIYATWGLGNVSPSRIHKIYDKRFGIESTYRQMNEALIKTTSQRDTLRCFFAGLGLILRNVWVYLHFHIFYEKRRGRGGRRICLFKMRFQTMLKWIESEISKKYPVQTEVEIEISTTVRSLTLQLKPAM